MPSGGAGAPRLVPAGLAVRGPAGDHPLLRRGPRLPLQEPPHLPQGHAGDLQEPGPPGRGLDGQLQGDLLQEEPAGCADGQRGTVHAGGAFAVLGAGSCTELRAEEREMQGICVLSPELGKQMRVEGYSPKKALFCHTRFQQKNTHSFTTPKGFWQLGFALTPEHPRCEQPNPAWDQRCLVGPQSLSRSRLLRDSGAM